MDSPRLFPLGSALLDVLRERLALDSCPRLDAVLLCWLALSPDSILGILLGMDWLLLVEILGLALGLLGELGDGILLAVDGLDCELLDDCDCDRD